MHGEATHELEDSEEYKLSRVALKQIGLTEEQQKTLMTMNDRVGNSFREIADWIDANIKAEN